MEGRVIAKEILERLNVQKEIIKEICDIIGHHHSLVEKETLNFRSFRRQIGRSILKENGFQKIEEDLRRSLGGYLRQSPGDHCRKSFLSLLDRVNL